MIGLIFYYIASASAILFYGIGINRTVSLHEDYSSLRISFFKGLMTAASTTAVSYIVNSWLFSPTGLEEVFPVIVILIYIIFLLFVEIFVGIGIRPAGTEFAIPLLSVILGINEGITIGHAVVITCCCLCSFYIMLAIFHSVVERVKFYRNEQSMYIFCMLLLSLAAIILALCGWNASWINLILGGLN
ncbi:MAG: hypothetical protein IJP61_10255 [Treponema sp.]|nr:hypothetical protein [Treponema sp.]